jgi:hypothetical protein
LSLDTWKLPGAVAVMLLVRLPPETSTELVLVEAVPYVVVNAGNVPLGVIAGIDEEEVVAFR